MHICRFGVGAPPRVCYGKSAARVVAEEVLRPAQYAEHVLLRVLDEVAVCVFPLVLDPVRGMQESDLDVADFPFLLVRVVEAGCPLFRAMRVLHEPSHRGAGRLLRVRQEKRILEALLLLEEPNGVTEEALGVLRLKVVLVLKLRMIVSLGCMGHDCDTVGLQHGLRRHLHACEIGRLGLSGVPCLERK